MWRLTGFGDEIDPDPVTQLDTLASLGIRHLELRGAWETNVTRLSDAQVDHLRTLLRERRFGVSAIASPIGKIAIGDDFAPHLADFQRVLDLAHHLEAPFVRIFSFFIPAGDNPAIHRDAVLDRLGRLVNVAAGRGITLLHENEKGIYGDTPERCHDLLTTIAAPHLRAAWDAANFVQCQVRPFPDGYELLRPEIAYLHVKDARFGSGEVVPAGQGDGALPETIAALHASGFDGFCSLEPHLSVAGAFTGYSGPTRFRQATTAFIDLLQAEGIAWS